MEMYVIRIGNCFVINDWSNINKIGLSIGVSDEIKLYTNEEEAKSTADLIGGKVIGFTEMEAE